jgi:purine-binding chemotaxis protein CheW
VGTVRRDVLLVRAGARVCALPLAHVAETMRPLARVPLPGVPAFVEGAAVVRGVPAPVVNLDALLGGPGGAPGRFVRVLCGGRSALLAVDAVLGVARLAPDDPSPGLLSGAPAAAVEALAARGVELLVTLDAARLVPDVAFAALDRAETAR